MEHFQGSVPDERQVEAGLEVSDGQKNSGFNSNYKKICWTILQSSIKSNFVHPFGHTIIKSCHEKTFTYNLVTENIFYKCGFKK